MALRLVSRTQACCSRLCLPLFTSRCLLFSSSSAFCSHFPMTLFLSRHLFSFSSDFCRRPLSLTCLGIPKSAARFTLLQCQVSWFSDSADSPLNSDGGGSRDSNFPLPPAKMDPVFPGCDFNHWLIVMDKPGGEAATKEQMIDCYIKTLAKVLGSEEAAKKKIYNVSCVRYFGFGCEIDEETANKLEGLPGVLMVLADSYVNAENKDYGAELFVNGEIVQRSPVPGLRELMIRLKLVTHRES